MIGLTAACPSGASRPGLAGRSSRSEVVELPYAPEQQNGIGSTQTVLRAFNPVSWFHPCGIHRVLARLKPMLPDVSGCLFLTFTVNPELFSCPKSAFCTARSKLRRVFFRLRKGLAWEGKFYRVDAPYCVKVEFHQNGWAHFHVVFLTRNFIPGELITYLWDLGRTDVRRINERKFHYLLKYVTKGGGLPEWVEGFRRLRVWQATKGFYREVLTVEAAEEETSSAKRPFRKRSQCTLGERLERWSRTAVLKMGDRFEQVLCHAPFADLFAELVFSVAMDRRYLGNGQILINDTKDILPWILPNPLVTH